MTEASKQTASQHLGYTSGGLKRETDWRGAFVMGLAGTILITGIGPVMVTSLGAACLPINIFITLLAWLNIIFIAELAGMMPERTGGSPAYAYPAYCARWPRLAKHINGFTAWAYWLGWFPVAPLNMILASFYLADRFHLNTTAGFTPIHTFIAWSTLIISVIGILLFFIPAYLGIRFGTVFATILAVLSMIPLTFIAVAWIFNPSVVHMGELAGFRHVDGSSFFSPISGFNWVQVYIAYGFLLSWNVIGIESAACYIGECANPDRDAKIALNLEGAFALFIFTLIPIAFIVVLGAKALSNPNLADPKTIFVTFASKIFPGVGGEFLNWVIAAMLIIALSLSALNAIMGCGRSLYQMAVDGEFPRWFTKLNHHGVPANAMAFNVACSLLLVAAGGAVEIYSFSNVGYVVSFVPVLIGYYLLRQDQPGLRRPFKLPEFMKYVALALAAVFFVFWLFGGLWYSKLGNVEIYYWLGWATLALYLPLYWYRVYVEDKRNKPVVEASAGS
jgi:amino acid transporter